MYPGLTSDALTQRALYCARSSDRWAKKDQVQSSGINGSETVSLNFRFVCCKINFSKFQFEILGSVLSEALHVNVLMFLHAIHTFCTTVSHLCNVDLCCNLLHLCFSFYFQLSKFKQRPARLCTHQ